MTTSSIKLIARIKPSTDDNERAIMEGSVAKPALSIIDTQVQSGHPWDIAYMTVADEPTIDYAEPDLYVNRPFYPSLEEALDRSADTEESYEHYIEYWPKPDTNTLWHLDDDRSQLNAAKKHVQGLPEKTVIRIAHFDTGYSSHHVSFPKELIRFDLQKNFIDDEQEDPNNAEDQFNTGLLRMPGHGTGTLSILAGTKVQMPFCNNYDDYIGLYDSIEIVPIRIAKSVVLFKSAAFVKALDYVVNELHNDPNTEVHVITMSMGGLPSNSWADLVNQAYEKGIFMVTAAGNNFAKLPTRTLVYPARFNRVVCACGVTYDKSPYSKPQGEGSLSIMEGNFGPDNVMDTAMAAFTPNVPWAPYQYNNLVGIRGDGTSSATPQIASAAALYYSKYYQTLRALPEKWMIVEAIRKALFDSAAKEINYHQGDFEDNYHKYFGNGILQSRSMLDIPVASAANLNKQKKDKVSFPLFQMLFGPRAIEDNSIETMFETELMQLVLSDPNLQELLDDEEKDLNDLSEEERIAFAKLVIANPDASNTLKNQMQLYLNQHP